MGVPVRVIPEPEAEVICEPALPEPEYQIELPRSLHRLRGVLDKMRAVGASHVSVEAAPEAATDANSVGKAVLRLGAEAELVRISATFPSLDLLMDGKKNPTPEKSVRLLLSLRRLCEVLAAFQQVSAQAHIACVLENRALVLYALLPNQLGSLISYTPAVII